MDQAYDVFEAPQLPEPPRRIVSLVPSLTETLFDLGLGARVVGVTDYCVHPARGVAYLPKVGGTKNPDVASILALGPDLVLANQEENLPDDVAALHAAGVPVWVSFPQTARAAMNVVWALAHLCNVQDRMVFERLDVIERALDWVESLSRQRAEQGTLCRVFAPIWNEPLMTIHADTYVHDLLRVCGGTNVFAERTRAYPLAADLGQADAYPPDDPRVAGRDVRYPRITQAEVLAAQPDVILLPSEPFAFGPQHQALFATWDVPAARHNAIHLVDGSLLTWHGTRLAYALAALPALMCAPADSEAS